jgi:hypothetical protein
MSQNDRKTILAFIQHQIGEDALRQQLKRPLPAKR